MMFDKYTYLCNRSLCTLHHPVCRRCTRRSLDQVVPPVSSHAASLLQRRIIALPSSLSSSRRKLEQAAEDDCHTSTDLFPMHEHKCLSRNSRLCCVYSRCLLCQQRRQQLMTNTTSSPLHEVGVSCRRKKSSITLLLLALSLRLQTSCVHPRRLRFPRLLFPYLPLLSIPNQKGQCRCQS